jgi:hypothetical protein
MLIGLGRGSQLLDGDRRALVLLLSIGERQPREEDECKCQKVLGLWSDMARWPSQHLGDNNAGVGEAESGEGIKQGS